MDIHDYLQRINYSGSLEPTLQTLQGLHMAHLLNVPFENLSIHYGQPISLQEERLFQKIVRQRRGGFCYELNGLFAWLLRTLGFEVTMLSAGVVNAEGGFGPEFDHLTLLVHDINQANWLVDVGFGDSFRHPLRFVPEVEQDGADGHIYRLHREDASEAGSQGEYWILQQYTNDRWQPQYCLTLQPHALSDFTEMCHYHQTSPQSHFTKGRICSLATPSGRVTLSNLRFVKTVDGKREERMLESEEEYKAALFEYFGITL